MPDSKISALTSYTNPDPVNDVLPIVDNTNTTTKKISRDNLLGITSAPVGKDDTQTLTAKTLTAPTINGATLSGTLSGTYTIGGTPTFPASVVTLTGSQTLTNKILTSPTINSPTITNASVTQDTVTGFTSANNGTLYGISVTSSVITSAAVGSSSFVTGVKVVDKMQNPYKFSVYRNTAFTPGSGYVLVPCDAKEYDTGSNVDIVTNKGRFTAPIAGFYYFSGAVTASSGNNGGTLGCALYKNGVLAKEGQSTEFIYVPTSNGTPTTVVGAQLSLAANDYIELYMNSNALAIVATSAGTYFQGFLMSAT